MSDSFKIKTGMDRFELENDIRKVVNDVLSTLNARTADLTTNIRQNNVQNEKLNQQMNEIRAKMDRDQSLRDGAGEMRRQILTIDKDLKTEFRALNDEVREVNVTLKAQQVKIAELEKERTIYLEDKDNMRSEIKDFELLMGEFRAIHDKQYVDLRKSYERKLEEVRTEVQEMSIDRNRLKAMFRNQNYHFTEHQKLLGCHQQILDELTVRTQPIEEMLKNITATDDYLRFYLPVETHNNVHKLLDAMSKTMPTRMHLDWKQASADRVKALCKQIDDKKRVALTPFKKDKYDVLKLDYDIFDLKNRWENEEFLREQKEKQEAEELANKKSDSQIFNEHLYDFDNINKLAGQMERSMLKWTHKQIDDAITASPEIQKLMEFYEDEMGRDSEDSEDESSGSGYGEESGTVSSISEKDEEEDSDEEKGGSPKTSRNSSKIAKVNKKQNKKKLKLRQVEKDSDASSEDESENGRKLKISESGTIEKRKKVMTTESDQDSDDSRRSLSEPSKSVSDKQNDTMSSFEKEMKKAKQKKEKRRKSKLSSKLSSDVLSDNSSDVAPPKHNFAPERPPQKKKKAPKLTNMHENDSEDDSKSANSVSSDGSSIIERKPAPKMPVKSSLKQKSIEEKSEALSKRTSESKRQRKNSRRVLIADDNNDSVPTISTVRSSPGRKQSQKKGSSRRLVAPPVTKGDSTQSLLALPPQQQKKKRAERAIEKELEETINKMKELQQTQQEEINQLKELQKKQEALSVFQNAGLDNLEDSDYYEEAEPEVKEVRSKITKQVEKEMLRVEQREGDRSDDVVSNYSKKSHKSTKSRDGHTISLQIPASGERGETPSMSDNNSSVEHLMKNNSKASTQQQQKSRRQSVNKTFEPPKVATLKIKEQIMKQQRPDSSQSNRRGGPSVNRGVAKAPAGNMGIPQKQKKVDAMSSFQGARNMRGNSSRDSMGSRQKQRDPAATAKAMADRSATMKAKLLEAVMMELKGYVTKSDFAEQSENMSRVLATIAIFKTQMGMFIKDMENREFSNRLGDVQDRVDNELQRLESGAVSPTSSTDVPATQTHSNPKAQPLAEPVLPIVNGANIAQNKKSIGVNLHLVKDIQREVDLLKRRMQEFEALRLKDDFGRLPKDIEYLSKSEAQLKKEMQCAIDDCLEIKAESVKELKRLRREHYNNLQDIKNTCTKVDQQQAQVDSVESRQSLNDNAMATIFKVMKINTSLEEQDELDKKNMMLMGHHEIGETSVNDKSALEPTVHAKRHDQSLTKPQDSIFGKTKIKTSTRIPYEQSMDGTANTKKAANIISLDNNCISCSTGTQNEAIVKAFKLACLSYEPSKVLFDNGVYQRMELIEAKSDLINYTMSQLKHLDLGNIEQQIYKKRIDARDGSSIVVEQPYDLLNPKDFPPLNPASARNFIPMKQSLFNQTTAYPDWMVQQSQGSVENLKYKKRGVVVNQSVKGKSFARHSQNLPALQVGNKMSMTMQGSLAFNKHQRQMAQHMNSARQPRKTDSSPPRDLLFQNQSDSLAITDNMNELSIDGQHCMVPINDTITSPLYQNQRMGIHTAGSPQAPQQQRAGMHLHSNMKARNHNIMLNSINGPLAQMQNSSTQFSSLGGPTSLNSPRGGGIPSTNAPMSHIKVSPSQYTVESTNNQTNLNVTGVVFSRRGSKCGDQNSTLEKKPSGVHPQTQVHSPNRQVAIDNNMSTVSSQVLQEIDSPDHMQAVQEDVLGSQQITS